MIWNGKNAYCIEGVEDILGEGSWGGWDVDLNGYRHTGNGNKKSVYDDARSARREGIYSFRFVLKMKNFFKNVIRMDVEVLKCENTYTYHACDAGLSYIYIQLAGGLGQKIIV